MDKKHTPADATTAKGSPAEQAARLKARDTSLGQMQDAQPVSEIGWSVSEPAPELPPATEPEAAAGRVQASEQPAPPTPSAEAVPIALPTEELAPVAPSLAGAVPAAQPIATAGAAAWMGYTGADTDGLPPTDLSASHVEGHFVLTELPGAVGLKVLSAGASAPQGQSHTPSQLPSQAQSAAQTQLPPTSQLPQSASGNAPLAVSGDTLGQVNEDGRQQARGLLSASGGHGAVQWQTDHTDGLYGRLQLDADGHWRYSLNNAAAQVQALGQGQQLSEHFVVSVVDTDGRMQSVPLLIAIRGENDRAVISGASTGTIGEDQQSTLSGKLVVTDVDTGEAAFVSMTQAAASHGFFSLSADGSWKYQLDNSQAAVQELKAGDTLTDQVVIATRDGTTQTISITITGSNDAPVMSIAAPLATREGAAALQGQLTATDVDHGDTLTYSLGQPLDGFTLHADGSYTFDPAHPAYEHLREGEQMLISVPVTVTDSQGASSTQNLQITLTGSNDAPALLQVAPLAATEDAAVLSGKLVATDPDTGDILVFGAPQTVPGFTLHADGSYSFDPSNAAYQHLAAGDQQFVNIPVTVTDQAGARSTQTLQIVITGSNDAPLLMVVPPMVTFEGSPPMHGRLAALDVDDHDVLTYHATAPVAGFTLNVDGSYTFDPADPAYNHLAFGQKQIVNIPVEVVDAAGATSARMIEITVTGTNDAPTLNVVPPRLVVEGGATVSGQLTATDPDDGATLTFSRGQPLEGLTLYPDGRYSFDPADPHYNYLPAGQTLTLSVPVLVTDSHGGTGTTQLQITITGTNDVPVIAGIDHAIGSIAGAQGGRVRVDGQLAVIDLDQGESHFQGQLLTGSYGVLEIQADGHWHYTADAANPALANLGTNAHVDEHFTVRTADGTTHSIDLQLKGSNAPAIFVGTAAAMAQEDQVATIHQHLTVTDPNAGESAFKPLDQGTQYGHFTMAANGDWTYQLDNSNPDVQALVAGKTLTDSIVVGSVDGTPKLITVTIMGTNDAAVISGSHSGDVVEDVVGTGTTLTADGQLTVTDPDAGQDHFIAMQGIPGDHGFGSFSVDAQGHWTYSADNSLPAIQALKDGATATDSFTVMTADGTRQTITVTLTGTNDQAVITGDFTGDATEGTLSTSTGGGSITHVTRTEGFLQISDVDTGEGRFAFQSGNSASGYGKFVLLPTGKWTYIADNNSPDVQGLGEGKTLTDSFTVHSPDGTQQTITVTIHGTNDAPTVTAVDAAHAAGLGSVFAGASQTFTEAQLLALVHATDVDHGDTLSISAVSIDPAYGRFTHEASGAWTFHPANTAHGDHLPITISVSDGTATTTAHAEVTVRSTLTGDLAGSVKEDAATTVITGDLHSTTGATLHLGDHTMAGHYGSLDLRDQGHWVYTLDNNAPAVQGLKEGETRTDTFTIQGPNGPSAITVTVTGTHDQPVIQVLSAPPPATVQHVTQVTEFTGATDLSTYTSAHQGVPIGTRIVGLYLPGDSHNLLASIAHGDLPVTAADYNTGNLAAAGAGYIYLNQHQWFGQHLDGGPARYAPVAPSIRNNFDGGLVVFEDGTVGRLVKVCDDDHPGGPGDYIYVNKLVGVNANTGISVLSGTAAAGGHVDVYDGQTLLGTATADAQGRWQLGVPRLADGSHAIHTVTGGVTTDPVTVSISGHQTVLTQGAPMLGTATEDDAAHSSLTGQMHVTDADIGDHPVFTAQGATAGTYGSFSVDAQGHWTYQLDNSNPQVQALGANDRRTESFTVEVTTDSGEHVTQTVTVQVQGSADNTAPTVTAVTGHEAALGTTLEDTAKTFSEANLLRLVGAADVDSGQTLHISAVTIDPAVGSFAHNTDGSWTFTPTANFNGQNLPVTLAVTDGTATTNAHGTLSVSAVNDAPTLTAQTQTATEDGAVLHGQMQATDPDSGDTLSYSTTAQVDGFTLNADGSYSFDPTHASYQHLANGQTLPIDIPITVSDGHGGTSTQNLQITLTGTDDAPIIGGSTAGSGAVAGSTQEISSGNALEQMGLALQNDPNSYLASIGSALLWAIGSPLQDGYDPVDNSFNDMLNGQNIVDARTKWVHSDFDIVLIGPSGTQPQTLAGGGDHGAHLYTSDANLGTLIDWVKQGPDYSVQFIRTPGAQGGFYLTDKEYRTVGGDSALNLGSYMIANDSLHGSYPHVDHFTSTIDDAHYHFAPRVTGPAPEVTTGDATEDTATTVSGTLHAHDVDDHDTLSFSVDGGGHGRYGDFHVNAQTGEWTYTLNAGAQGLKTGDAPTEDFTILVTDASGQTARQTMTMTVHGKDDVSVISGEQTGRATEDNPATTSGTLTISDADTADHPAFVAHDASNPIQGTYGSLTLDAQGHWVYTLDASRPAVQALNTDTPATDHLTVHGADGSTATIAITITGSNDAPVLSEVGVLRATAADTPQTYLVAHLLEHTSDVDDKTALHIQNLHADPAQGTVSMSADGRSFTFTPAAGFHGIADLHYDIVDAHGGIGQGEARLGVGQSAGQVTLDYRPTLGGAVQLAPAINDGTTILIKPAELIGTSTDPDGDALKVMVAEMKVDHGTIHGTDSLGNILYTPEPGYTGPVAFTYDVTDWDGFSPNMKGASGLSATLTLTQPPNTAPTVTADAAHAADLGASDEDTAKIFSEADLLRMVGAHDGDAGAVMHIGAVTVDAQYGAFAKQGSDWVFTPTANFDGSHLPVTLTVTDGTATATAHAALDVTPVADTPTLSVAVGAVSGGAAAAASSTPQLSSTALLSWTNPQGPTSLHFDSSSSSNIDRWGITLDSGVDPTLITSIRIDGHDVAGAPEVLTSDFTGETLVTFAGLTPDALDGAHRIELVLSGPTSAQFSGSILPHLADLGMWGQSFTDQQFGADRSATAGSAAVQAVPDLYEDHDVPLVITAASPDGSETLSITLSGLPAGATLSAGTDNHDGSWTLTPAQLQGLHLTPPHDFSGTIPLHVSVTSTDGTDTATTATDLQLTIHPEAEQPTLTVADLSSHEDAGPIALNIGLQLNIDPSETASIVISGLVQGTTLSAGTHNADGTWTLTPAQLQGLTLTAPDQYAGTLHLTVTATSTEATGESATQTANFAIHVDPVMDMSMSAHDLTVSTQQAGGIALPLDYSGQGVDSSESLGLDFTLTLPSDQWRVEVGGHGKGLVTDASGTHVHLWGADLASAVLIPPAGFTGDADIRLTGSLVDGTLSSPVDLPFTVHVQNPVAPPPMPDAGSQQAQQQVQDVMQQPAPDMDAGMQLLLAGMQAMQQPMQQQVDPNHAPTVTDGADLGWVHVDNSIVFQKWELLRKFQAQDADSADRLDVNGVHVDPYYGTVTQQTDGSFRFTPAAGMARQDIPFTVDISDGHSTTTAHGTLDVVAVQVSPAPPPAPADAADDTPAIHADLTMGAAEHHEGSPPVPDAQVADSTDSTAHHDTVAVTGTDDTGHAAVATPEVGTGEIAHTDTGATSPLADYLHFVDTSHVAGADGTAPDAAAASPLDQYLTAAGVEHADVSGAATPDLPPTDVLLDAAHELPGHPAEPGSEHDPASQPVDLPAEVTPDEHHQHH